MEENKQGGFLSFLKFFLLGLATILLACGAFLYRKHYSLTKPIVLGTGVAATAGGVGTGLMGSRLSRSLRRKNNEILDSVKIGDELYNGDSIEKTLDNGISNSLDNVKQVNNSFTQEDKEARLDAIGLPKTAPFVSSEREEELAKEAQMKASGEDKETKLDAIGLPKTAPFVSKEREEELAKEAQEKALEDAIKAEEIKREGEEALASAMRNAILDSTDKPQELSDIVEAEELQTLGGFSDGDQVIDVDFKPIDNEVNKKAAIEGIQSVLDSSEIVPEETKEVYSATANGNYQEFDLGSYIETREEKQALDVENSEVQFEKVNVSGHGEDYNAEESALDKFKQEVNELGLGDNSSSSQSKNNESLEIPGFMGGNTIENSNSSNGLESNQYGDKGLEIPEWMNQHPVDSSISGQEVSFDPYTGKFEDQSSKGSRR